MEEESKSTVEERLGTERGREKGTIGNGECRGMKWFFFLHSIWGNPLHPSNLDSYETKPSLTLIIKK